MTLYHGSDSRIEEVDLSRCEPFKDFGKGFYTTAIRRHAEERAHNVAENHKTKPVVTVFSFDEFKGVTHFTLQTLTAFRKKYQFDEMDFEKKVYPKIANR
ncbi:MAG: DUF3990 domain-containing protein [Prevotellaceae bacterium]|jgi:hypothetical protein|nr:DUF3990 domain-containing protein [Prevotellaceae bacterium]